MKNKKAMAMIMAAIIASLTACGTTSSVTTNLTEEAGARPGKAAGAEAGTAEQKEEINTEDMFSERDMEQSPDLSEAERIEVSDNKNVTIDTEGIYVISGEAKETTIYTEVHAPQDTQIFLFTLAILAAIIFSYASISLSILETRAFSGIPPIAESTTLPFFIKKKLGMLITPNCPARSASASVLTFPIFTLPSYFLAISSTTGIIILHGPHQSA